MKNQKILIPFDVKEFYVISSKNIIIFKVINAAEHYSFFLIIIQN